MTILEAFRLLRSREKPLSKHWQWDLASLMKRKWARVPLLSSMKERSSGDMNLGVKDDHSYL